MALIVALISGAALWTGFAPMEFWLGPYLGVSGLYWAMQSDSRYIRIRNAFVSGLIFFGLLLHWSGSYVGAIPWLLLTLLQATIFALLGILRLSPWSFAASFTLIEILRMKAPFGGFGWGRVGFTQIEPLHHIYPLIGVTGVTFLVSLLSSLIARINLRQSFAFTAFLLIPFFSTNTDYSSTTSILAVQGGVDQLGLDFNSRAMSVFNRHLDATYANPKPVDLIVWPENSSDIDPVRNIVVANKLQKLAEQSRTPLLIGAVTQGNGGPENVSILYGADGKILSKYQKQDLAPFGEYIPLRSVAERIAPEAKRVRDFQPGDSWTIHRVAGANFASIICFEILDDDLIRQASSQSDFLVAQTNNATFGDSSQARQQLQITQARAAELGRDIAVVSTTGFTAKVAANGEIEAVLPQFKSGSLAMELGGRSTQTLASELNSWLWVSGLALILVWSRRSVFSR